ncbi:MAG TPA: vWA domain-containing protein [Polyangia bacterium]|nr:vWA domain-containing protein [Polyangia bacterium]
MDKRKLTTYGLISGVLILAAWAASAMPRQHGSNLVSTDPTTTNTHTPSHVTIPQAPPRVELVFALDTTGSMSGLIDGAKRKIWSIAQFIAEGQPKPDVRIGLVAYRDIGDAYVTRFYDLSDDLDTVFEHLSSFEAGGGGDTPEHVSKALYDAVYKTSWTADQSALKQIYLVGDAPPHTDYSDGYDYKKISKHAHDLGIHINTIRCGSDPETAMVWNQIANSAAGEFASIDQTGGVRVAATPFDGEMQKLNAALVGTAIGYGRGRAEVTRKVATATAMSAPAAADRAGYFGVKGGAVGGGGDLVDDVSNGKARIGDVKAEELPAEMAAMDESKREAYVKEKVAERNKIQTEINTVAKHRQEWLKKNAKDKTDAFDVQVEGALKKQAKSIGLAL